MTRSLNVLTNSSVTCYRTCPRKYYWRIIREIASRSESKALIGGSYCHGHWSGFWGGPDDSAEHGRKLDEFERAKLDALLRAYDARWDTWRIESGAVALATEKPFAIPLVNPDTGAASTFWELHGKLDAILLIDNRPWLEEHKSTSDSLDVGSGYFERLRIDSQMSVYNGAMRALGFEDFGILYDVARKPQLRPLQATKEVKYNKDGVTPRAGQRLTDETPEEYGARCLESIAESPDSYFAHFEVTRLESEVDDSARDLWFTAASIRESMRAERWPRNPSACYNYKSFCEYWPICSGVADASDPRYEHKAAHSELAI